MIASHTKRVRPSANATISATTNGATPPWNAGWSKISLIRRGRADAPQRRATGPGEATTNDAWQAETAGAPCVFPWAAVARRRNSSASRRDEPSVLAPDGARTLELAHEQRRELGRRQPEELPVEIAIEADGVEVARQVRQREPLPVEQREHEVHLERVARDAQAVGLEG